MKKFVIILVIVIAVAAGCYYSKLWIPRDNSKTTINFQHNTDDDNFQLLLNESFKKIVNNDVRNIILFIGDGMGTAQITASRISKFGPDGRLTMEKMPVTGLMNVHSRNNLITDSAASGTAISTGFKTNNRMIAMLPDSTRLKTILEKARDSGLATGLVATSAINHATPAVFAAHVCSRYEYDKIAKQLLESKVNVLLGGGKKFFLPDSTAEGSRTDNLDLIEQAQSNGYEFLETRDALLNATSDDVLGLFKPEALENKPDEPSLAEMTRQAIKILSRNENGFFLMVEGSQIDWAGHKNDLKYSLREMYSFDDAVKAGLEFALQDEHTLVVVTADHETGGMNITGGSVSEKEMEIKWISKNHTGGMVPIFSFGPQAYSFTGLIDNTDVGKIFARLLKLEDFPQNL